MSFQKIGSFTPCLPADKVRALARWTETASKAGLLPLRELNAKAEKDLEKV